MSGRFGGDGVLDRDLLIGLLTDLLLVRGGSKLTSPDRAGETPRGPIIASGGESKSGDMTRRDGVMLPVGAEESCTVDGKRLPGGGAPLKRGGAAIRMRDSLGTLAPTDGVRIERVRPLVRPRELPLTEGTNVCDAPETEDPALRERRGETPRTVDGIRRGTGMRAGERDGEYIIPWGRRGDRLRARILLRPLEEGGRGGDIPGPPPGGGGYPPLPWLNMEPPEERERERDAGRRGDMRPERMLPKTDGSTPMPRGKR